MSDSKAKMHQIRFLLVLRPRGAYSAPSLLAVFKGPTSKEREGRKGYGERRLREGFEPPKNFGVAPAMSNDDHIILAFILTLLVQS